MELPSDINDECRAACLLDFEHGRGHLIFQVTLKTSCFLEPPLVLLGCAHYNPDKPEQQREVVRKCFSATCEHPQFQKLQETCLREEIALYLDGEDLRMLDKLPQFLGSLRFAFGTERRVEGGHAQVNMWTQGRRNRTEATDSLALRMSEIKCILSSDSVTDLLECIQVARNPQRLITKLGLQRHPSCSLAKHAWDPIYRKVVYHADPHSLYDRNPPQLFVQAPAPKPDRVEGERREALMDQGDNDVDLAPEVADMWKSLALSHVRSTLQSTRLADRKLFSCELPGSALKLLFESVAAPEKKPPEDEATTQDVVAATAFSQCTDLLLAEAAPTRVAFFRVVQSSLSRAKLANAAGFDVNDIGILLLKSNTDGPDPRVGTTALSLPSHVAAQYGLETAPLVLALSSLTLRLDCLG